MSGPRPPRTGSRPTDQGVPKRGNGPLTNARQSLAALVRIGARQVPIQGGLRMIRFMAFLVIAGAVSMYATGQSPRTITARIKHFNDHHSTFNTSDWG